MEDCGHFLADNTGNVLLQIQLHQAADIFKKKPDLNLVSTRWVIAPHQDRRQDCAMRQMNKRYKGHRTNHPP